MIPPNPITDREREMQAEIERLRAALKPFADYVKQIEGETPPRGSGPSRHDWLKARDVYEQTVAEEKK